MNEGEYLEAMNQLKEKFDDFDKKMLTLKEGMLQQKKDLCSIYGLVRIIDNMLEEDFTYSGHPLKLLIETTRSFLSEKIEEMLNLETNDDNDDD
mgnify:CR=1 FL=1